MKTLSAMLRASLTGKLHILAVMGDIRGQRIK